ncbi:hypothetical protein [Kribbella sp. VKM Ac-2566]|uniref:hypothetical protein n=1 Tax=Kribbella sp. VKM Ac-2566 TaxID=2512218 RepID=UPI0010639DCD|nr:hypothetical protein [Kribbella sp. VKM Ac-2566]TDW92233.1 hypothetical protein EV647_4069 [Kribbella sp. VKM Ac-2566]
MTDVAWPLRRSAPRNPWFRQHPSVALVVAVGLYGAVLLLTLFAGTPGDDYFLLYVFPVALIAMTFGLRAGALAGMSAVAFVVVWVVVRDISFSTAGWAARVAPLLVLGLLLGMAADRLRWAEAERLRLEAAALLHREAIEINDSLVQGMAAARWSLQAGEVGVGVRILDGTIDSAQELVSDLIRRAGMGRRSEPLDGSAARRPPVP